MLYTSPVCPIYVRICVWLILDDVSRCQMNAPDFLPQDFSPTAWLCADGWRWADAENRLLLWYQGHSERNYWHEPTHFCCDRIYGRAKCLHPLAWTVRFQSSFSSREDPFLSHCLLCLRISLFYARCWIDPLRLLRTSHGFHSWDPCLLRLRTRAARA